MNYFKQHKTTIQKLLLSIVTPIDIVVKDKKKDIFIPYEKIFNIDPKLHFIPIEVRPSRNLSKLGREQVYIKFIKEYM